MNEIMSLMNRDISGWMCSGDDEAVTAIVFKNLLYKAAEQHFVQVVIASDHYVQHVPVWEAQYRKEEIHDMQKGICLVQADTFEGYVDLRR